MLQGGFYIGGSGISSPSDSNKGVYTKSGNVFVNIADPIRIDENDRVFFDAENGNAKLYMDGTKIMISKVV